MKINEVYKKFGTPPNLKEHMIRVCGIVSLLENNWKGEQVDWILTKKIALLHDLGNVVRFDLDSYSEFLGNEQKNVEKWKVIQDEVIKKYGTDDHEATQKMLNEIGLEQDAIETILNKSFGNVIFTMKSNN